MPPHDPTAPNLSAALKLAEYYRNTFPKSPTGNLGRALLATHAHLQTLVTLLGRTGNAILDFEEQAEVYAAARAFLKEP